MVRRARFRRLVQALLALLGVAVAPVLGAALEGAESLVLDDFKGISRWSQSNWAEADTDPTGRVRYVPRIEDGIGLNGEPALSVTLHFKPGGYSQGVVLQSNPGDWSKWDELVVDVKLVQDVPGLSPRAKAIIFPDDQWTESADAYSVALKPGEWVTLRVPLGESMPSDLWSTPTDVARLARVRAWAVKFFALNVPETSEPVQIIIARPRLIRAVPEAGGGSGSSAGPASGETGVTVSSLFRIPPGAPGAERVEVAGLTPAASTAFGRIALTLSLKPGLFGPAASLRLETRPVNLFPSYLAPVESGDELGPYYSVEVWSANALSTRANYEATLSFSDETGVLSVAFGPQGGDRLVEGHLRLEGYQELGALVAAGGTGASDAVTFLGFEGREGAAVLGAPFGIPQGVRMRVAAAGDEQPFAWVAQNEVRTVHAGDPLRVAFQGLGALPLDLEIAVLEDGGRRLLWTGRPPPNGEVIVPGGAIEPGRHVMRLSAVDRGTTIDLAETEVEVVHAFLSASARVVDFSPRDGRMTVEVALSADRPVAGLTLALTAGEQGGAAWAGPFSLDAGEVATVTLEVAAGDETAFAVRIAGIPTVRHPPEIPVEWSEEGLAAYLRGQLEAVPAAVSGPLTRAELAATIVRWLRLAIPDETTISSDFVAVSALRSPHRDEISGLEGASARALQDLLQAGVVPAAMLPGDRFRGEVTATVADAAILLVRAREFAAGTLYKTPARGRPRQSADYAGTLVELGCLSRTAELESPLSPEKLVELAACALKDVGLRPLLVPGDLRARYVIPGTEAYRPEQPYSSVGTFGLWSRGQDVRAKGWLGNEHQRGLLAFAWRPVGAGFDLYWPRFGEGGGDLILGRLEFGGALKEASYAVFGPTTARWETAADAGERVAYSSVYLSRAFPAVLSVSESDRIAWRIDGRAFEFDRIQFVTGGGMISVAELPHGAPLALEGELLGAPWVLLYQTAIVTGEPVPLLIRLENRPEQIVAERNAGLVLKFQAEAGSVAVMPLYGIRRPSGRAMPPGVPAGARGGAAAGVTSEPPAGATGATPAGARSDGRPAETNDVSAGPNATTTGALETEAAALAHFWSRALAAFPVGLEERYEVDEGAGVVRVTTSFSYREIADAWGTKPLRIAPVAPVIAMAEAGGYPVRWGAELERSETATFLGPFAFQRGTEAKYELPLYAAVDQVYVPLKVTGDPELEALQARVLEHVRARWFQWPSPAVDSTLLAAHARAYALVDDAEAKVWYKERIAQSLAEYYDERNLATVVQPANGQSYVYNERIWAAGEDFDREYYIGRQLAITGEVAQWVGWDVVRPYWDAVRGLYAYYRIHWDWAWQGSTTFQTGFSFQADGVVLTWEGILNVARMARLAGDEVVLNDALYRAAALGASMFALWDLTDWAIEVDYAVMHPGHSDEPPHRRPPGEILTGFLPDAFSEFTGVVTTMPTEWGASNWLHDELMGRTRFYNDYRFAEVYDWQVRTVPRLYPAIRDSYNARAHLGTRSSLYGKDPGLEAAIVALREEGAPGPQSVQNILLRSLVPQVWVSASTARVTSNVWDAGRRRLVTEIEALSEGRVTYEWAWRSMERIDPSSPEPDPGPPPAFVLVNGNPVDHGQVQGGWRRVLVPVKEGDRVRIEVAY